jgi:glycerophosphoryl diester phosphodiesterase
MEKIAHRGASLYAPENTIEAFQLAFDMGADWIECDIGLSADGIPCIIHDDYLDRTTNGKGLVSQFDWLYLQSLDAGSWFSKDYQGIKIPSMTQVLKWLEVHPVAMNFEMKTVPVQQIPMMIEKVSKCLQEFSPIRNLMFSSFQLELLQAFKLKHPDIAIAALSLRFDKAQILAAKQMGCLQFNIYSNVCTPESVEYIHGQGMKVAVFTVNSSTLYQQYQDWGADAIFTDDLKMTSLISERS